MGICMGQRIKKIQIPDGVSEIKADKKKNPYKSQTEIKFQKLRISLPPDEIIQEIRAKKRLSGMFLSALICKDQKELLKMPN